jgi:hypothetical protein
MGESSRVRGRSSWLRRLLVERRGTITLQWALGASAMAGVAALSLSGVRTGVEYAASAVEAGVSGRDYDPDATQRQMDRMNRRQQQAQDAAKKQQELEEEMRRLQEELDEQRDDETAWDFFRSLFGDDSGAEQDGPVAARRFEADSPWRDDGDDD